MTGPHGVKPQMIDICEQDIDEIKYQTHGRYDKQCKSISQRLRWKPKTNVSHELGK